MQKPLSESLVQLMVSVMIIVMVLVSSATTNDIFLIPTTTLTPQAFCYVREDQLGYRKHDNLLALTVHPDDVTSSMVEHRVEEIMPEISVVIDDIREIHAQKEQVYEANPTDVNAEAAAGWAFELNYYREYRMYLRHLKDSAVDKASFVWKLFHEDLYNSMQRCYMVFHETPVKEGEVDEACAEKDMIPAMILHADIDQALNRDITNDDSLSNLDIWLSTHPTKTGMTYNYRHAKLTYKDYSGTSNGIYVRANPNGSNLTWDTTSNFSGKRAYMCMYLKMNHRQARVQEMSVRPDKDYEKKTLVLP